MNLKHLRYLLLGSSTIALTACMTSPGYLFSQTQDSQSTELSQSEAAEIEKPVISEKMQALSQSCRNNEALKTTDEQHLSSALKPLSLPIRQGLIDLACQLSDQQIAELVIYIPPVESPANNRVYASLIHQTLVSQAKLLGIKVMRLAISSAQSSKLNGRLLKLEHNSHPAQSVLQLNLISADTQTILASKQVVLQQNTKTKQPIGVVLLKDKNTSAASKRAGNKAHNAPEKSVFLKP